MNAKKALIVDDSRLAQFVLKKMLADYQLEVDISDSAEEALSYLAQQKPDMIFLDHTMPGMNGLEALKKIKGNPDTATIPVMMYTSQEDSSYMVQARELGAIDVLPKQLNTTQLEQALTQLDMPHSVMDNESISADPELSANDDSEKLEQLVINAEAALDEENIHQKWQKQFDEQREEHQQKVNELETKINALLPAAETARNRQTFWNNLLWGAIYLATVITFSVIYIQQKNEIQSLALQLDQEKNRNLNLLSQLSSFDIDTNSNTGVGFDNDSLNESSADLEQTFENDSSASAAPNQANRRELESLVNLFNENNELPYSESLLDEAALSVLNDLIPALQTLSFSGRVNLLAHDGSFCVSPGALGQFDLAEEDISMSQCDIVETSTRLADIASVDFLQAITAMNQSAENNFIITIDPKGNSDPREEYPEVYDELPAEEWNDVALSNRRLEIELLNN
jgi:CheY-like chemotaxis protein